MTIINDPHARVCTNVPVLNSKETLDPGKKMFSDLQTFGAIYKTECIHCVMYYMTHRKYHNEFQMTPECAQEVS